MTIVKCDKCGKEIPGFNSFPIVGKEKRRCMLRVGEYELRRDVCPECYDEIFKILGLNSKYSTPI